MVEDTKCTLAQCKPYATSTATVVSQGLPRLQKLLAKQGIEVDGFDDLYTAAISIIRFVAAKERKTVQEKLNLKEDI